MTEQDYRTADAPGLPVQPATIPSAPAAVLPTQPAPAPAVTEPAVTAPTATAHVPAPAEPLTQPAAEPAAEPVEALVEDAPVAAESAEPVAESAEEPVARPSRPSTASRRARRPAAARKITRYTLDLEANQHQFLRIWSVTHSINASQAMRSLLYLLEAGNELPAGVTLADLVLDEIFADDDE